MNAFRERCTKEIAHLNAQIEMLMERIKWLENPPKAPHEKIKREEKL